MAQTLEYYRQRVDAESRDMAVFLTLVTALILSVTCLGIFGLTSFNVSTRTKQIGTLRAVGARKRDVVAHFLIENAIILIAGALIGCTLALAVGYWLSDQYQLPRLDLHYLADRGCRLWPSSASSPPGNRRGGRPRYRRRWRPARFDVFG